MFTIPFTIVLVVFFSYTLRLAGAAPLTTSVNQRDVVDPPVTAPNASTVWVVGETQTVVWNTSSLPSQITNTKGTVLLGFVNDTTGNEHLMINSPLASGFDIRSGSVNIVVPNVEPRSDYIVALLGDSGNISPKFTITNGQASSASSAAVPSSTTTVGSDAPSGSGVSSALSTTSSAASPGVSSSVTDSSTLASSTSTATPDLSSNSSPSSSFSSGSSSLAASDSQSSNTSTSAASPRTLVSFHLVQLAVTFLAVLFFI